VGLCCVAPRAKGQFEREIKSAKAMKMNFASLVLAIKINKVLTIEGLIMRSNIEWRITWQQGSFKFDE
jgi:hypothetical protein